MGNLSDIFKFTQGLGQKGHQIGRKVGDAIELLTLGMINLNGDFTPFLVIEDGVEGATTAKHKVEFSFYNLDEKGLPTKESKDLFGIIECKKVGVEVTVKQSFKVWKSREKNKQNFYQTDGYSFGIAPRNIDFKWKINVCSTFDSGKNLRISILKYKKKEEVENVNYDFLASVGSQVLIALDVDNQLFILGPDEQLSQMKNSLSKCVIISIKKVSSEGIEEIKVDDSLPGPQTPEKAKQASFVSLDVRKKVLGRFDKTEDKSFISILVIGEGGHWKEKSRSMVRLCNDHNLIVPDNVLVYLFKKFEEEFGIGYQTKITKTNYRDNSIIKPLVHQIIQNFEYKILQDMATGKFVKFKHLKVGTSSRIIIEAFD